MSTIEAIGNQFDIRKINRSLIIGLAAVLIVVDAAVIVARLVSSNNTPISSAQPIAQTATFPLGSQSCLQNCAPLSYQPTAAIQPAATTVYQPAINVINY